MYVQCSARDAVPPIPGKIERLHTHLAKCCLVPRNIRFRALTGCARVPRGFLIDNPHETPVSGLTLQTTQTQSSTQQTRFEEYICRIACSNGWSWNSLNNPEFLEMIAEIRPDLKVPNRHALGGRLLESQVMNAKTQLKNHVQSGLATGMCDGWKNVSKTSLLASMATVNYQVNKFI